jgi:hypothetical protein
MTKKSTLTDRFGNPIQSDEEETPSTEDASTTEIPEALSLPEVNFTNHVISLMTSATSYCGIQSHPEQPKPTKHKGLAKYHIDTIQMLFEKTKSNLDEPELKFIEGVVFELKNIFIKSFSEPKKESPSKDPKDEK